VLLKNQTETEQVVMAITWPPPYYALFFNPNKVTVTVKVVTTE